MIIHEQYNPGKPPEKKPEAEKGPVNEDRRKFLRGLGILALVGAGMLKASDLFEKKENKNQEKKENKIIKEEPLPELKEKFEQIEADPDLKISDEISEDIKKVKEVLKYKTPGRINIDEKTAGGFQNYWEEQHRNNLKFSESLKIGMEGIEGKENKENADSETYLQIVRTIFNKEAEEARKRRYLLDYKTGKLIKECKVPEDFKLSEELVFLSIAESYWDPKAKSPKGAVGIFQLMKQTAIDNGLKVGDNEKDDDRYDVRKNAMGSARCLIELLVRSKGDVNLALAGYNGSYIWSYLNYCGKRGIKPSYKGFLHSFSQKINERRDFISNKKTRHYSHEVGSKQSLDYIAKIYKVEKSKLRKYNKLKSDILKKGQMLKIPLNDERGKSNEIVREAVFDHEMNRYAENLVYPPKYHAILKLIREQRESWFNKEQLYAKK